MGRTTTQLLQLFVQQTIRQLHKKMARLLHDMSQVCKLWKRLLCAVTYDDCNDYYRFKPGINRHITKEGDVVRYATQRRGLVDTK
jgi:hypothetical protein